MGKNVWRVYLWKSLWCLCQQDWKSSSLELFLLNTVLKRLGSALPTHLTHCPLQRIKLNSRISQFFLKSRKANRLYPFSPHPLRCLRLKFFLDFAWHVISKSLILGFYHLPYRVQMFAPQRALGTFLGRFSDDRVVLARPDSSWDLSIIIWKSEILLKFCF